MPKTTLQNMIGEKAKETGLEIAVVDLMPLVDRILELERELKKARSGAAERLFKGDRHDRD